MKILDENIIELGILEAKEPVSVEYLCTGCYFVNFQNRCNSIPCRASEREDKENKIFVLSN